MIKFSLVLVAALSFTAFGCKKKGGDCGAAIAHSMDLSKADMAKMPGFDDKLIEKMRAMGVQHCTDDKWAPDVVTCMSDAKTEVDAQGCYGKLTSDQRDKMTKAATALMTPPGGAGAGGAGAGGAGAGGAGAGGAGAAAGSDHGAAGSAAPAGSDTGAAGSAAPVAGSAAPATGSSAPATGSDMAGSATGSAAAPK